VTLEAKIRILYITPAGERGGAEVVLLTILRHLDRSRFEPAVICLQDGPLVEQLEQQAKVHVEVVPAERFRDLRHAGRVIRQLRHVTRSCAVDLVHCNGTGAHLYGSPAARLCGVPSIYHLHDVVERSWDRQGLVHLLALLAPATATIAVSHYVARCFHESWRSRRAVHVIHNAVDPGGVSSLIGSEGVRGEYGWPARAPLVVWCGRLQRWKGTHIFLKAAARVRQQMPTARFLVVGDALFGLDADYSGELHAMAKTLNLDACLGFAGHQPDARRFVAATDVFVHSSIRPDPFGLVILEAMALGKPVIASGEGGPLEIVEPNVTGLLVPPNDPDMLAEAMITLLQDEALRDRMGKAGLERAERSFSVSRMMQAFETLYQNVTQ